MWNFEIGNENFGLKVWDLNIWNLKLNLLSLIRSKKYFVEIDTTFLFFMIFLRKKKKKGKEKKKNKNKIFF